MSVHIVTTRDELEALVRIIVIVQGGKGEE